MSQIENKVERRGKDKDDGLVVDVELEHRSSYEKIKGKGVNAPHLHRQCLLNFSWKFPKKPNYHITIFNVTPQCEFKSFEKTKKKKKTL